jgi:hypothetical protein
MGCFENFSRSMIWSIIKWVYKHTQTDKWVCTHAHCCLLKVGVTTPGSRKNAPIYIATCAYSFINLSMMIYSFYDTPNYKFFQKNPYFLICYYNTMTVVYKISITIYSKYTCIHDIRTTIDGLVWLYTSSTDTSTGYIHLKSKDIHMGATTPGSTPY